MKLKTVISEIVFNKIIDTAGKSFNQFVEFCKKHRVEVTLSSLLMFLGADNLHQRFARRKAQKQYIKTSEKSKKVMLQHEVEIQSLKSQISEILSQEAGNANFLNSSEEEKSVE